MVQTEGGVYATPSSCPCNNGTSHQNEKYTGAWRQESAMLDDLVFSKTEPVNRRSARSESSKVESCPSAFKSPRLLNDYR